MPSWQADYQWSRRFLPAMKSILGRCLGCTSGEIQEASPEEDQHHNSDLVLQFNTSSIIRIACRIRKHNWVIKYPNEITIRAHRDSGNVTELEKIKDGWGDYFLYGFADEAERAICAWVLGDLDVFREYLADNEARGRPEPGIPRQNHDGSSWLRAYRLAELPEGFVLARLKYQPASVLPPPQQAGPASTTPGSKPTITLF